MSVTRNVRNPSVFWTLARTSSDIPDEPDSPLSSWEVLDSSDLIYEAQPSLDYDDATEIDDVADHLMQKVAPPPEPRSRAPTRIDRRSTMPPEEPTEPIEDTVARVPAAFEVPETIRVEPPGKHVRWIVLVPMMALVVVLVATVTWAVKTGALAL